MTTATPNPSHDLTETMLRTLRSCIGQHLAGQCKPGAYSSDLTGGYAGMSYSTLRALARRGLITRIADIAGCLETYYLTDDGLVLAADLGILDEEIARYEEEAEKLVASRYPGLVAGAERIRKGIADVRAALAGARKFRAALDEARAPGRKRAAVRDEVRQILRGLPTWTAARLANRATSRGVDFRGSTKAAIADYFAWNDPDRVDRLRRLVEAQPLSAAS